VQDLGATGELTLTNALFGLTVLAWLLRRVVFGGEPLPRSAIGPAFAIFVAGLTLSLIVARDLALGVAALFQWIKALTVYFLALDLLRTRRQVIGALVALLIAGAGEAAIGLVQYTTGIGPASFAIGAQFSRAYGTFGRPNSYAGYLEMILPLAVIFAWWLWRSRPTGESWQRRALRLGALGAAGLIGLALLASFSRGAWLGTAGAFGAMIVLTSTRTRAIAATVAIVGGVFLLLGGGAALPSSVQDRVGSILGNAAAPNVRTAFITAENFAIVEAPGTLGSRAEYVPLRPPRSVSGWAISTCATPSSASARLSWSPKGTPTTTISTSRRRPGLSGSAPTCSCWPRSSSPVSGRSSSPGRAGPRSAGTRDCDRLLGTITAVAIHNVFEHLHVLSMGIQLSTVWALLTIVARPAWIVTKSANDDEAR
jgi:hypothetical protein